MLNLLLIGFFILINNDGRKRDIKYCVSTKDVTYPVYRYSLIVLNIGSIHLTQKIYYHWRSVIGSALQIKLKTLAFAKVW
jgi:hypothetical protein